MSKTSRLVGCQTILWGRAFSSRSALESALGQIADAGFCGVEFFQSPKNLGVGSIDELRECLSTYQLKLAGLTGGSIRERLGFLGASHIDYLYADCVDEEGFSEANELGIKLGIHPHLFGEVETLRDAEFVLQRFQFLRLIPDTAHVFAAGDDLAARIESFIDRIVCLHLKDWKLDFGASSHRYARGFCNLGLGDVPLDKVLEELQRLNYDRWVVWELDKAQDIGTALKNAAAWLQSRSLLDGSRTFQPNPARRASLPAKCPAASATQILDISCYPDFRSEDTFTDTAQYLVEAVRQFHGARFVNLWENTAHNRTMTLIAATHRDELSLGAVELDSSRSKECVLSQECRWLKLAPQEFGDKKFASEQNLDSMAVYPVVDEYNIHLTRYLLCVFPQVGQPVDTAKFEPNLSLVSRLLRCALDTSCATTALKAESLASRCNNAQDYCRKTSEFIAGVLKCDRVWLLFPDPWSAGLILGDSGSIQFGADEESIKDCWRRGRRVLRSRMDQSSELVIPIRNGGGNAIGVTSCYRSRREVGFFVPFTDDDAAVAEAAIKSFCQRYEQMVSKERRDLSRRNLQNDLGQPINNLTHRFKRMNENLRNSGIVLPEHLVSDMQSWGELIRRLIVTAPAAMLANQMELSRRTTLIVKHVIAAVVRQSKDLLEERGFHPARIRYEKALLPPLNIDRNRFQEVFFNLLSNAIKYAHRDPGAFNVEIEGFQTKDEVGIKCRDWGRGIPREVAELVFQESFRYNPETTEADGEGLGLAMVRKIVESHGGTVFVSGFANPTEITISLPLSLASLADG